MEGWPNADYRHPDPFDAAHPHGWHQELSRFSPRTLQRRHPNYRPRDLAPPNFEHALPVASLALARTEPGHIVGGGGGSQFHVESKLRYEVRPGGNAVNHEDEMMKVASNQMDYEAVTSLYTRSLALIKLVGRQVLRSIRIQSRGANALIAIFGAKS